ncbi:MAG: hypothetical protein GY950_06265 [bacterium]|nr:hypothetical protein [bacterium]
MRQDVLIPVIAVGIAILVLAVVLAVIVSVRRKRRREEETPGGSADIPKGASGENTYQGTTYRYKHFRGTDKAPPYFSITIPFTSPGAFKIVRETKFDRFFKKLGVCVEIETHDPTFDDTFYITTDTIPFTRRYLEKSENRQNIQALFQLGFNHLKHDGKSLTLTWNNFPRKKQMEMETIEKAVAPLAVLGGNLAKILTHETPEPSPWKLKRFAAFALPISLLVSGFVFLMMGLTGYKPLDGGKVFADSLAYSVPLFLLFTWIALHLLKGRSSSHRELIAVFFIALFGFPLAGFGYRTYLNGALDTAPPAVHEVMVVKKYYSKSKNSYSYYAVVESWRENRNTERLGISKRFYNSLTPRSSTLTITTKPGKFGYQWIVALK